MDMREGTEEEEKEEYGNKEREYVVWVAR